MPNSGFTPLPKTLSTDFNGDGLVAPQFIIDKERIRMATKQRQASLQSESKINDLRRFLSRHGLGSKRRTASGQTLDLFSDLGSPNVLSSGASTPGSPDLFKSAVDYTSTATHPPSNISFLGTEYNKDLKKYGKGSKLLGSGAGGTVRLVRRRTDGRFFAIKEFRQRDSSETSRDYSKQVTAEFCVSTTLRNLNIIETVDIVHHKDKFYQVMEYAPYDLYAGIMTGRMTNAEIYCVWRQIVSGVDYLHSLGLAHRDLKIDNCCLTQTGIVKIIDFGTATIFKYPNSTQVYMATGEVGSDPYIAPEVISGRPYDPGLADVWSLGIILVCMLLRRFPWKIPDARKEASYRTFLSLHPELTSPLSILQDEDEVVKLGGKILPSRVMNGVDERGWFDQGKLNSLLQDRDNKEGSAVEPSAAPHHHIHHCEHQRKDASNNAKILVNSPMIPVEGFSKLDFENNEHYSMSPENLSEDEADDTETEAPTNAGTPVRKSVAASGIAQCIARSGESLKKPMNTDYEELLLSTSPASPSFEPSSAQGGSAEPITLGNHGTSPAQFGGYLESKDSGPLSTPSYGSNSSPSNHSSSILSSSPLQLPPGLDRSPSGTIGNQKQRSGSTTGNATGSSETRPSAKVIELKTDVRSERSIFRHLPEETRSCLIRMLAVEPSKRASLGDLIRGGDGLDVSEDRRDPWLRTIKSCAFQHISPSDASHHTHILINPLDRKSKMKK